MPVITLSDQTKINFDSAVTVLDVAKSIGPTLAKITLAGKINGVLYDASNLINQDSDVQIITYKDAVGIEIIRHSTAHLLAHAVKQLFPKTQVTIGPTIENGFYYDFAHDKPFTTQDLKTIEKKMQQLVAENYSINRSLVSKSQAIKFFTDLGETYKVKIIESIPSTEDLSLYTQGDFTDLCRGPHVPSTGKLKAFKLMKISGAYWRGNSKNEMLQRIYGTAWADKKTLQIYLHRLEEAEKRDHRKLAKTLNLFHTQEEAPGMVFWHEKGWIIYQQIEQYIRKKLSSNGYVEVKTPQLVDQTLWEKSGHWDKFGELIFTTNSENRNYAIKPMNCPCHIQIYNHGLKSYRDLPIRMAEFGSCHRNEPSGTLHGLMRVRNFVQDDAHIFCTEAQVQTEVSKFIDLLFEVYKDFGFTNILIKLSTRPENRVGSDEVWNKAENALRLALNNKGLDWKLQPNEGAFYGPKIEFSLKDCLERVWQCGTIQVDFSMPEHLNASYVTENGTKNIPVLLHRAILGSLERFIGILLEQHAGTLPLWLSPVHLVIINIAERHTGYTEKVGANLEKHGYRVKIDLRNENISFKIREHSIQRIPYIIIIGDQELSNQTITVRSQKGENLGSLLLDDLLKLLAKEMIIL